MRPRTRKLVRDLWTTRGRVALMVVAVAVAVTGVGGMLAARAIVLREAAAAYGSTNPAAATFDVSGGVDATLLADVRQRPGIVDAAARQTITTRVKVGDEWRRMLLFVIDAEDPLRIARFTMESGRWPTPDGALLLERAALPVLNTAPGDEVRIAGADGRLVTLRVDGSVYDPALAPAAQERTGYGYLTPATAAELGYQVVADQLKIVVGDDSGTEVRDQATVDSVATELAAWLRQNGHDVHEVAAPPYQHPHQNQTNTITSLFLAFAVAALILAAVLVATTLGGMLAAQTRQIGVMKTVGASTAQLLRMYLTATAAIALAATALALPLAILAGNALAQQVAALLNIELASRALPASVFGVVIAAGLGLPLLIAAIPLARACRISVRTAINDHAVDPKAGTRRIDRLLTRLPGPTRLTALAARNTLRRPTRLLLTLILLAAGGALFTAGLSTAAAWQQWVDDGLAKRTYDAELTLATPAPIADVTRALATIDTITAVETLVSVAATPASPDSVQLQRTYPDGGHGRFNLVAVPPDTPMINLDVLNGRWLRHGDTDAAVLNQAAADRLGNPANGTTIVLSTEGQLSRWYVVGTVAEVGGPATVYTPAGSLANLIGGPDRTTTIRIQTTSGATGDAIAAAERTLADAAIPVATTIPTTELRSAVDEHVVIFSYTLIALAVLMAIVGILGLASSTSIAVTERTREHGIMQAIGATPAAIRRLVLTEGTVTGAAGCAIALAMGIPLTAVIGDVLGRLAFSLPLPLHISGTGLATWTVIAITTAAAATLAAARRAARLTIRETLTYQ